MTEISIFFKTDLLVFGIFIPVSFRLDISPLKFLFWQSVKLYHCISFMVLHILKTFTHEMDFLLRKQEKSFTEQGF